MSIGANALPSEGAQLADASNALPANTDLVSEYRLANPEIDAVLRENEQVLAILDEAVEGAIAAFGPRRNSFVEARSRLNELKNGPTTIGPNGDIVRAAVNPTALANAEREFAETKEALDTGGVRRKDAIGKSADQRKVTGLALSRASAMARQEVEPVFVPPATFKGSPVDVVEDQRARHISLLALDAATQKRPRLKADALADAIAEYDRQAQLPDVKVRRDGSIRFNLPVAVVGAVTGEHAGGEIPHITDLRPMVMRLARTEMLAHIEQAIDTHYAGLTVEPISDADRAAELERIAQELAAAERVEVAAIRAARKAGHAIAHRPDVNINVVLGLA